MSDLISRQKAIEALVEKGQSSKRYKLGEFWELNLSEIKEALDTLPSAEPERKKGNWIKVGHWGRTYKCNQCGNYLDFDGVNAGRGDVNFCPNCGADMRGDR